MPAPAPVSNPPRPCGRFAPTPSGPLHLGSLLAATGSYLSARSAAGRWLLRIEDLDRNRAIPDIAGQMLRVLESFGFQWDGNVKFQNDRTPIYKDALTDLRAAGLCYACRCSRSQLAQALEPGDEPIYPGTCRNDPAATQGPHALRFRTDSSPSFISFLDRIQGQVAEDCSKASGDFVIRRRDGFFAYHFAVVVDDELQGVTEVVRGCDLLSSTPRQILLQRSLGLATPRYLHFPVATDARGEKLSKQNLAASVDARNTVPLLRAALDFLGQAPVTAGSTREMLSAAAASWDAARIPRRLEAPAAD